MVFPLSLPHPDAATICGADGATVAACADAATASALVAIINAAADVSETDERGRGIVAGRVAASLAAALEANMDALSRLRLALVGVEVAP